MNATTNKPRVLVVDDNEDAAATLGALLEAAGYDVATCFDGRAALQAADRFGPDACVLDINMPGMDGYELARRLRAKAGDDPPVFATVTAYEDYGHLTQAADAGFDLHFTKPADPGEVLDQLGDCVRKQATARAAERMADGVLAELDEGADLDESGPEHDRPAGAGPGGWVMVAAAALATAVVVALAVLL